jgi:hypothetical protein
MLMDHECFAFGKLLEVKSTAFPPVARDEELVNDGMHGFALAQFIAERLAAYGLKADPDCFIAEDWGWYCPVDNPDFALWYGCNADNEGEFIIQIEPSQPRIRKGLFRKVETTPAVTKLADAIFAILKDSGKLSEEPRWV